MAIAEIKLSDGRVVEVRVPDGATREQVGQFVQQNLASFESSQSQPRNTRQQRRLQERQARSERQEAAKVDPFEGLPAEVVQDIEARFPLPEPTGGRVRGNPRGTALNNRIQAAKLEQLRLVNPWMAQDIEETSTLDAAAIAAGRGMTNVARGLGLAEDEDEATARAYEGLASQSPTATGLGEFVGETAPFLPLGVAAAAPRTITGRGIASAAAGGVEGGVLTSAAGGDKEDILKGATLGAVTAGTLGAGVEKGLQKAAANRLAKSNKSLFDQETGLPNEDVQKALAKKDMDFGALIGDGENVPAVYGNKNADQVVNEIIKSKLKAGDQSDALYKFRLEGNKVVNDDLGEEAFKQGFRKGDISSAKSANRSTKRAMSKMLNKKRSIQSNQANVLKFRPSDDVGDAAMQRFNYIRDRATALRKELDKIASTEIPKGKRLLENDQFGGSLRGRQINTDSVADSFFESMDDAGIQVDANRIPPKLDFSLSSISEDGSSKALIKKISRILSKDKPMDAAEAHFIKREIDNLINYQKQNVLTPEGEKVARNVRSAINESIRQVSPRYARINDELSSSIEALDNFDKALGSGIKPMSDNADKAVGQALRKLLSNVQSRADLDSALTRLDEQAAAFGGEFDVDVGRLVLFNKMLDEMFGATARTSLAGEVESSIRSGPTQAAKDALFKKAAEKLEEFKNINETEAFNVMERILRQTNNE